jgi:hypothetical protein
MVPVTILPMKLFDILPTLIKDADSYALLLVLQG